MRIVQEETRRLGGVDVGVQLIRLGRLYTVVLRYGQQIVTRDRDGRALVEAPDGVWHIAVKRVAERAARGKFDQAVERMRAAVDRTPLISEVASWLRPDGEPVAQDGAT